jgi:hypothetical protein
LSRRPKPAGVSDVPDAEVAASMRGLAEAFIEGSAEEGEQFGWDSTEASRLDEVCEAFLRGDPPPDVRHSMVMALGAYLGELMVRNGQGHWSHDANLEQPVVEMPNGLRGYPLNKVAKRLEQGPEHNLFQFYWYALTGDVPPGSQIRQWS